jgi:phage shock protein C
MTAAVTVRQHPGPEAASGLGSGRGQGRSPMRREGSATHGGAVRPTLQNRKQILPMNDIRDSFRNQGLVRPRDGRVLAGVCAGLGRRFGIDPWPARLLFVLLLLVVPGSQLLVYPILWILMPTESSSAGPARTSHAPTT